MFDPVKESRKAARWKVLEWNTALRMFGQN